MHLGVYASFSVIAAELKPYTGTKAVALTERRGTFRNAVKYSKTGILFFSILKNLWSQRLSKKMYNQ